ncbi:MAG: RDD family protein [Epsilonproteobacteria bacterium]|nr:RDD family protein [Campylobacterota bacterium]
MSNVQYAGFWIRFVASLLDTFLLALPVGIVIYFLSGGEWFDFAQYQQNLQLALSGDPNALQNQPTTSFRWELVFELAVLAVTVLFWEKFKGATPGKKMVGIRIVDAKTFQDISNKQAITRSLGYIPSTLLFGLGFLMVLLRKDKRALHDILADTAVLHTQK